MDETQLPVLITISQVKNHTVVEVQIFSNIEKAKANFLILCAEWGVDFDSNNILKWFTTDWYVSKNNKTAYIEWKKVQ